MKLCYIKIFRFGHFNYTWMSYDDFLVGGGGSHDVPCCRMMIMGYSSSLNLLNDRAFTIQTRAMHDMYYMHLLLCA